jgi:hypothetical protein
LKLLRLPTLPAALRQCGLQRDLIDSVFVAGWRVCPSEAAEAKNQRFRILGSFSAE